MKWFVDLFKHPDAPDEPARVALDSHQQHIADELSEVTGKRRDDVLAEAYRQTEAAVGRKRES